MFAIFSINISNRSTYVLIANFSSGDYLKLRATEDLKISISGGFFGEMQCCCALLHDLFTTKISSF